MAGNEAAREAQKWNKQLSKKVLEMKRSEAQKRAWTEEMSLEVLIQDPSIPEEQILAMEPLAWSETVSSMP